MNKQFIELLAAIGLVRVDNRGTHWPIHIAPWWIWKVAIRNPPWCEDQGLPTWFGIFRNPPETIKWPPGRLLPRRWGFYILGLEIGDRG